MPKKKKGGKKKAKAAAVVDPVADAAEAERLALAKEAKSLYQETKKEEEDARRVRAGLKPKTSAASNACDFCQKVVRGKRRSQMFQRLDFAYCSTECVRRHQRELTAAAATARLGG